MDVKISFDIKVDSDGVHCGECLEGIKHCPFYPEELVERLKPSFCEWAEDDVRFPACIKAEKETRDGKG